MFFNDLIKINYNCKTCGDEHIIERENGQHLFCIITPNIISKVL